MLRGACGVPRRMSTSYQVEPLPPPPSCTTMPDHPAPVAPDARVAALDVLRGFALFGVLWSNLNHYNPVAPASALDRGSAWMQEWLIQNRFYSLLGFLFGVGFAVQLHRASSFGKGVLPMFYRRMLALLLFGVLHGTLIWSGDILTRFALVGGLLPFYRRLSPRGLVVAAGGTLLGLAYATLLLRVAIAPGQPPALPDSTVLYATGSWLEILPMRVAEYRRQVFVTVAQFWSASVPFLTLFVLGLAAARAGILNNLRERAGLLRKVALASLACVGLGIVAGLTFGTWWPRPALLSGAPGFDLPHLLAAWWLVFSRLPQLLIEWGTAGVYAAGVTLLTLRPRWNSLLAPLGAVGRMSLTTYLVQSLVSTGLFYGYGLGWYGRVSYTGMLTIAVLLFAGQLAVSTWWFRSFRFGPCEWLWRSLAYGKAQPMRLVAVSDPSGR